MRRSGIITWTQLRVGGLILLALAILAYAVLKLGKAARLFGDRYTLVAFVQNAAGLRVGGQVNVAGQLAGAIKSIDFLPVDGDTTRNLRIVVELDKALQTQVRSNSLVVMRNQGLLGDRVFDITPGTPQGRVLREGETLQVGPGVDYDQMMMRASTVLTEVVGLTHDLRTLTTGLSQGKGSMGQFLTNRALYDQLNITLTRTGTLLTRLQNPNGSVGRLLDDPALYENLTHMIVQVDTLVSAIQGGHGTISKLLRDDSLYTQLTRVTANADTLASAMAHGKGTAAKLFTDDSLYNALVQSVNRLNALLADIKRDPKRYTKGAVKLF